MARGKRRMENKQKIVIFFEILKFFFETKNVWRGVHVAVVNHGISVCKPLAFVLDFQSNWMVIAYWNCLLQCMQIVMWYLPLGRRKHQLVWGTLDQTLDVWNNNAHCRLSNLVSIEDAATITWIRNEMMFVLLSIGIVGFGDVFAIRKVINIHFN